MEAVIAFACGAALGIVLGAVLCRASGKRLRQRNRELRAAVREGREPAKRETTKLVIWICLLMGFAWVWCSYILAWMDKVQIAESLSQVAVTEIIGVVLAYCIKSAVENLSKNNRWPDKQPADTETTPDQDDTDSGGAVG